MHEDLPVDDEMVKAKNWWPNSLLKIINTEFALGMTGTPVENGMHELWQIMDILAPGFLSTLKLFKETYDPDAEGILNN